MTGMNRQDRRANGIKNRKEEEALYLTQQAIALRAKGHDVAAAQHYRAALEKHPDQPVALMNLGLMLYLAGEVDEAHRLLGRLARLEPKNAAALTALALVQLDRGERGEALYLAEKAALASPTPQVLAKLGILYREAGLQDKARQMIFSAIGAKPDYVSPYYSLQHLWKFSASDPYFAGLQALEGKEASMPLPDRIMLHFGLGKAYLDVGDAGKAFHHYAEGNQLQRGSCVYDIGKLEKYIDSVIRLFDARTVSELKGKSTADSPRPVFIVGLPRSGSSLVDQIISSHPQAASMGETSIVEKCLPVFPNTEVEKFFGPAVPSITAAFMQSLTPEALTEIGRKYLSLTDRAAGGKDRLVDKMLFNFVWAGVLKLSLPQAKIIHCMRDPMDMGLSIWQTLFSGRTVSWGYDLSEIGRYYNAYRKLMSHWNGLFPDEILEVRYESVVADQEGQTRRLLDFCGLPWDGRCLRFFETERQVKSASSDQVRQPVYGHAVSKARKHAEYLAPLAEEIRKGADDK